MQELLQVCPGSASVATVIAVEHRACLSKDEQLMSCANSFLGLASLSIHNDWDSILDLQNFKHHFTHTRDFVHRQNTD